MLELWFRAVHGSMLREVDRTSGYGFGLTGIMDRVFRLYVSQKNHHANEVGLNEKDTDEVAILVEPGGRAEEARSG